MKISKLFHWLYCILMLFPFFGAVGIGLVWTFNTGSEVPTVPQKVDKEIDFNQLIYNGNFYGTNYWTPTNARINAVTGVQLNVFADYLSDPSAIIWFNVEPTLYVNSGIENHIYYLKFTYFNCYQIGQLSVWGNDGDLFQLGFDNASAPTIGRYRFTLTSNYLSITFIGRNGSMESNSGFSLCNVMCFDLTRMFGEGNEPSTEEFDAIFTENYYNTTRSTRMVLENYDTIYVPDNWTNYIWLPSFGGMGATIKSVFTYLIQTMFGISVATGTGGYIVLELLTYWLCISLIWLCFDVIMYVPLLIHRWLDKGVIS